MTPSTIPGTSAITGGFGFLGWHLACRLRATSSQVPLRLGRDDCADPDRLAVALASVQTVYHVAGVNRASNPRDVEQGNRVAAQVLSDAVRRLGRPIQVVYADSVQRSGDTPYGRSKASAGQVLRDAVDQVGGSLATVALPNLFGEHGRPFYNSFVATFCHEIAQGRQPSANPGAEVPLLHAQNAAQMLIDAATSQVDDLVEPPGIRREVGDVLALINSQHELYIAGEIPDLSGTFERDVFNTYRSYMFPKHFPFLPKVRGDPRGGLFEGVRSHGGTGQVFVSSTKPGACRGDHYHLKKVERFLVVSGDAEIGLRKLYSNDVVRLRVSGDRPGFVDMPTMWVHNITNTGSSELITVFWADQLLDPDSPDQYAETVEGAL